MNRFPTKVQRSSYCQIVFHTHLIVCGDVNIKFPKCFAVLLTPMYPMSKAALKNGDNQDFRRSWVCDARKNEFRGHRLPRMQFCIYIRKATFPEKNRHWIESTNLVPRIGQLAQAPPKGETPIQLSHFLTSAIPLACELVRPASTRAMPRQDGLGSREGDRLGFANGQSIGRSGEH